MVLWGSFISVMNFNWRTTKALWSNQIKAQVQLMTLTLNLVFHPSPWQIIVRRNFRRNNFAEHKVLSIPKLFVSKGESFVKKIITVSRPLLFPWPTSNHWQFVLSFLWSYLVSFAGWLNENRWRFMFHSRSYENDMKGTPLTLSLVLCWLSAAIRFK